MVQGVSSHLMMAVRQSIRSCFSCLEIGDSSSAASDSSLGCFLLGRSLGQARRF